MSSDSISDRISKTKIEVSNLQNSLDFYTKGLKMKILESNNNGESFLLGYKDTSNFNIEIAKSSHAAFSLGDVCRRETLLY